MVGANMKFEDYQQIYAEILKLDEDFSTVILPVDLEPGEDPSEAFYKFLIDEGFIETQGDDWKIKDRDKIEEFNPSLLKLLDSMIMASVYAEMDMLVELGYVFMTIDEDGNIMYELTEYGEKYLND